jgi:protease IV
MIFKIFGHLGLALLWFAAASALVWVSLHVYGVWHDDWSGYTASTYIGDGFCNIAVLPVQGEIHTYGTIYDDYGNELISTNMTDALGFLDQAEVEPGILGVMALIDSGGGSPSASKIIADELKGSQLPVAAFILDIAASGGYYIATGADTIIANPFADVGSIGVTMSYLDYTKQNAEQGLEFIELASGKFKDSWNPDKPITEEERALFERDLKIHHDTFVKEVSDNRGLPLEAVARLADGSTLPAPLALEAKLIDSIGWKEDVRLWFAEQLNMSVGDIVFCQ